jgi:pyruvate-formate lyase-activating enzyme
MIDKPKRGLVDEPGSYSQESKKLGEKGFTGVRGYTDAEAKKVYGKLLEGKKWSELSKKEKRNLQATFERRKKGQKARTDYIPEDANDLKKIAKEYVDDIKKGLKNEDLSKVAKSFTEYLKEKFPERSDSLEQAFSRKKIERPSKQILYDARQKLASKLVLKPNLTKKDIIKKLTPVNVQTFSDIVGIDVKKLPEYKFKRLATGFGAQVEKDLEKLFKSKIITNKLNKNTLPTITDVSKVLKTDPTLSLARLLDLSDSIQDSKYSKILKDKADKFIESAPLKKSKNVVRRIYERRFKSMI